MEKYRSVNAEMANVVYDPQGKKNYTAGDLLAQHEFFVTKEIAARRKPLVPQPSPDEEVDPIDALRDTLDSKGIRYNPRRGRAPRRGPWR